MCANASFPGERPEKEIRHVISMNSPSCTRRNQIKSKSLDSMNWDAPAGLASNGATSDEESVSLLVVEQFSRLTGIATRSWREIPSSVTTFPHSTRGKVTLTSGPALALSLSADKNGAYAHCTSVPVSFPGIGTSSCRRVSQCPFTA
jgi:hypothetical protein